MDNTTDHTSGDSFYQYEFHGDRIWCEEFNQEVMMDWEAPIMERMAAEVCHNRGDVLEVGFGMGISAGFIQSHQPRSHTVIECHPQILERLRKHAGKTPGMNVIHGMWQDVIGTLGDRAFDGILWDTFGGVDSFSNRDLFRQFFPFVKSSLRPQGRFTFWNPMPDPIATWDYGLEGVTWTSFPVDPPPNAYFEFQTYCMPLWIQDADDEGAAAGAD